MSNICLTDMSHICRTYVAHLSDKCPTTTYTGDMMKCGICGGEARPVGPTHEIRIGYPVCRGPVCQYCYENKVQRALSKAPAGERRASHPKGFWLYIGDDGSEFITSDPRDLILNMLRMGHGKLTMEFRMETMWMKPPYHAETDEERQESLWAIYAQHCKNVPQYGRDFYEALWIN